MLDYDHHLKIKAWRHHMSVQSKVLITGASS
ncbi:SDR family oxidoreductase, partial [Klebsiella pneumoniae]